MRITNTGADLPEPTPANEGAGEAERASFAAALAASPPRGRQEQAPVVAGQAAQGFEAVDPDETLSAEPLSALLHEAPAEVPAEAVIETAVSDDIALGSLAVTATPLATEASLTAVQVSGDSHEPANSNGTPPAPKQATPRPQLRDPMAVANGSPIASADGGDENPGLQNARMVQVAAIDGAEAGESESQPSAYGRSGGARAAVEHAEQSVKAVGAGQGDDLGGTGDRSEGHKAMSRDAARAASQGSTPLVMAAQLSSHVLSATAPASSGAAAAPAPTAAPPPAPMAEQLAAPTPAADIRFVEGGGPGQQNATVELMHPELGPIQLRMKMHAQTMDVRAITTSLAASMAVRAGESSLREDISKHGVSLRGMRVDIAEEDENHRHRRVNRKGGLDMEA